MPGDKYGNQADTVLTQARQSRVFSASGLSADLVLDSPAKGVRITAAGTLVFRLVDDGHDLTLEDLVKGDELLHLRIAIVRDTGTTCSGILWL